MTSAEQAALTKQANVGGLTSRRAPLAPIGSQRVALEQIYEKQNREQFRRSLVDILLEQDPSKAMEKAKEIAKRSSSPTQEEKEIIVRGFSFKIDLILCL